MLNILGRFEKQPAEVKDYVFNAAAFLLAKTDTILEFDVEAELGITLVSATLETGNKIRVFVSGGTDGMTYKITCTIVTVGGRTEQGEIEIVVTEV